MGSIIVFKGGGDDPGWVPDTYYVWDPPVSADGIPAHEPRLCEMQLLHFARGLYLGCVDGKHVFRGKPVNDPRNLPEGKRLCFFHVEPDYYGSKMRVDTPPPEPRKRPPWVNQILKEEGLL